ncbi:CxC2 domain-containing protein [Mycena indigotica]|uniref:CxC2 domain-containing protein n=1 Tax=Mycena indigotica TaxID=2126181 RepID=A0A8H6W3A9_9AGAR|nr:CxC2 domain-containing protein [Mycena indigotica]KAF7303422.1 CxC2 domain-containing protein [Mycena indigotica]
MASSSSNTRKRRATGAPGFVRHHILSMEELVGAPPDAPLTTSLHRVTNDNRRVHTQSVVVEPTSPVKRARLNHLHRQDGALNHTPAEDPERYEICLEGEEEEEDDVETNAARHSQPAAFRTQQWIDGCVNAGTLFCNLSSGAMDEARKETSAVHVVTAPLQPYTAAYLALVELCHVKAVVSKLTGLTPCISLRLSQKWTGVYFIKTTLRSLGLRIQLAHPLNEICDRPMAGRSDFVVLAANGIHEVAVDFCGCMGHDADCVQLLKAGWYPATTEFPRTSATFSCLDRFHYLSLHGKTTTYDFYSALESCTDGTGIKPPDRYSVFMRISRQYRHLLLLKRKGRGHDRFGVMGTASGELAIRCPACPRPGINLPEGWENAPPEDRCLYIMFIAMDACFRLKRRSISNELRDPGLGTGWAYMVEWEPYRAHLLTITDEQEMSTCSGLAALDHANTKFSRGYSVTGVGMGVCARHEFVLPNGVGDLQAGERYGNMDYIFGSFMRHIDARLWKILSYDILPPLVRLRLALALIRFAIPKMHIKGHLVLCQILFSLLLILGSGMTDGEGIERPWSMIGGIAGSTRVCGPGARWDQLDDHWSFWNWLKLLRLAVLLRRRTDNAKEELARQELDFEQLSTGHADRVLDWKKQVDEFEADNMKPNPYEYKAEGMSETAVRKMLEEQEAEEEKSGALPIHDISPTEFIVALLDVEGDQRRIRGLVDVGKKRSSTGVSLRRQRRKLNRSIKRLRTLQATYMPAALLRLDALHLTQETLAEHVPLLPPSALTAVERENGGCREGLVAIEQTLRDAQCRSSLTSLQLQLHVKARLLTYKKNNSCAQVMNTRSRSLVDQNEQKILLYSEKYQQARRALVALEGEDLILWRKLEKKDIRCMEDAEEVSRAERKRERAERNERRQDMALAQAGLLALPKGPAPMETTHGQIDDTQLVKQTLCLNTEKVDAKYPGSGATSKTPHRESKKLYESNGRSLTHELVVGKKKYGYWTRNGNDSRSPLVLRSRRGLLGGRGLTSADWEGGVAEGMIAYATKQADIFRNLAARAEIVRTSPKLARGKRAARAVNVVYLSCDDDGDIVDGLVDVEDEDEHGNASDDDEM